MEEFIRTRSRIKLKLSRITKFTEEINANVTNSDIHIRIEMMSEIWSSFDNIQTQIECACSDDDLATHQQEQTAFESSFCSTKSKLMEMVETRDLNNTTITTSQPSHNKHEHLSQIRLPKIELPTFSGNYQHWTSFADLFTSVIHNNVSLSPVQKLHYLKSSLKGDAARLISSVAITDANYDGAWAMLKERYCNTRQIVQSHLKSLYAQPRLTYESHTEIRKLVDVTVENIRALHALGLPTNHWDQLMMFLITERLDGASRRQWELTITEDSNPTFDDLKTFLERRCRALEASSPIDKKPTITKPQETRSNKPHHTAITYHTNTSHCIKCKALHPIFKCEQFIQLPVQSKIELIKASTLCYNCLRDGHSVSNCRSSACKICSRFHNTLLHIHKDNVSVSSELNETNSAPTSHLSQHDNTIIKTLHIGNISKQVVLATAVMTAVDHDGHYQPIRALLDSGSQATLISEACVQRLGLTRSKSSMTILGLGSLSAGQCKGQVQLHLASIPTSFKQIIHAFILPKITNELPAIPIDQNALQNIIQEHKIQLADPHYYIPAHIDVLLGADVYYELILTGKIKDEASNLVLQNTAAGWIIAGKMNICAKTKSIVSHVVTDNLSIQLQKFWEIEELPQKRNPTLQESKIEQHFKQTYTRAPDGRFVVKLPFISNSQCLGDTQALATQRFLQIEKRLQARPSLLHDYTQFMKEYQELNHMQPVSQDNSKASYYLPHHYVIRTKATTTKLRVVFDGSAQPTSGLSLNQALMIGPNIQDNLTTIVTRFRMHNIVFTADIAKMYRQVLVHPMHRDYQRIIWRSHPDDPLQSYQLNTLTYGTSSAPFLAIRCLQELALTKKAQYPLASTVITQDFYVDDVMTGSNTVEEAQQTQMQLINLLREGGFELHKWTTNCNELLTRMPQSQLNRHQTLHIDDKITKTLGIHWHSQEDTFSFQVEDSLANTNSSTITKRTILSFASKLFDPLGWVAPVVITAKLIMQQLWLQNTGWDKQLPLDIITHWKTYQNDLQALGQVKIPRQMIIDSSIKNYQLHGFSDASEQAYGAAIYIRSQNNHGMQAHLICSKSRVAPLKRISLPKLELCGAVLLAKLLTTIKSELDIVDKNTFAWTDSTIVLSWISKHAYNWNTFVANRVSEIQQLVHPERWRHVRSEHNPADCLTRGVAPHNMKYHHQWWNGPSWLTLEDHQWPKQQSYEAHIDIEARELKQPKSLTCIAVPQLHPELLSRFSSFSKLIRITAYCFRFLHNLRAKGILRKSGHLSVNELARSEVHWIKLAQAQQFPQELDLCKHGSPVSRKSPLVSLCPFLDDNGVLRVRGRLQEAQISYNQKHPIIMPTEHILTKLLIIHYHHKYLHAGPQLLMAILRTKYWIVRAKNIIRTVIHKCQVCFRHRVTTSQQLMGNLPTNRVETARPFARCGIDYAGPISVKTHKNKGSIRSVKAYICIIICFATKAIHLELAGDLTTQSFLAALKRFVSRRGKPTDIYTDCGTNFVGANKELKELHALMRSQEYNNSFSSALAQDDINWHFNPPAAPHFGGLWEAGVKSTKYHLRRTLGLTVLTYEELNTLLTQVEACLNSRPLCPITNDPDDLTPLTPGHFLTGGSLVAIPEQNVSHSNINTLTRWQLIQKLLQQFWKRWTTEYLTRLQQRPKWTIINPNLQEGDLVLIKDENISPLQWPMARVTQLHSGKDGLVRTVTLKTCKGTLKRPIVKCILLPMNKQDTF